MFGVVSSEEHVLPPYIFETGLRVNSEIYIEVKQTVDFPWMKKVARGRPWPLGLPARFCSLSYQCSDRTVDWLKRNAKGQNQSN